MYQKLVQILGEIHSAIIVFVIVSFRSLITSAFCAGFAAFVCVVDAFSFLLVLIANAAPIKVQTFCGLEKR